MAPWIAAIGATLGLTNPDNRPITQAAISALVESARADSAPAPQQPPRRSRFSGVGTGIVNGAIQDLDNNTEVRGARWYGSPDKLGIAQKMLRDPHVRQSLAYISDPMASGTWRFLAASKSAIDREAADFLTFAFFERLPWTELILPGVVRRYGSNGFELLEMTDDNVAIPSNRFPLHPGNGIGLVPTGMHEIPAHTIDQWNQSKTNPAQLASIRQRIRGSDAEPAGWREIPADRFMRFTYDQDAGNFTGLAILRSAYAPWKLKIAFQTLDAIRHERLAVPTPVITASDEATEDDLDACDEILAQMRSNDRGFLTLASGYTFKWEGSGDGDAANTALAIERCNKDIAYNVACGYMLLGLTGQSGSYALGTTQQTQHHLTVDKNGKFVSSIITLGSDGWSPAERILRANYGDGLQVPRAAVLNLPTRNWAEIAKTVNASVSAGTMTADDPLEEFLRESMQLPPADPATARTGKALQKVPQPEPEPMPEDGNQDQVAA